MSILAPLSSSASYGLVTARYRLMMLCSDRMATLGGLPVPCSQAWTNAGSIGSVPIFDSSVTVRQYKPLHIQQLHIQHSSVSRPLLRHPLLHHPLTRRPLRAAEKPRGPIRTGSIADQAPWPYISVRLSQADNPSMRNHHRFHLVRQPF